jgi:hypothetical protein
VLTASPAHHEIRIPRAAFGTAQQPRPIDDGHPGAMLCDLGGNVGLGSVIAALAPHDQSCVSAWKIDPGGGVIGVQL